MTLILAVVGPSVFIIIGVVVLLVVGGVHRVVDRPQKNFCQKGLFVSVARNSRFFNCSLQ